VLHWCVRIVGLASGIPIYLHLLSLKVVVVGLTFSPSALRSVAPTMCHSNVMHLTESGSCTLEDGESHQLSISI
jgi:hypothetical protein